jgi:hypothetical protein
MFELIDQDGFWIACIAMGRNAVSTCLKTGTEVVLYNISGRGPIGGHDGALYLFKDALAVKIAEETSGLEKRKEMKVK